MKKFNILFYPIIACFFLTGCKHQSSLTKPFDETQLAQVVNDFIDQWHQSATDADFDSYFNSIASDGIFVGTASEEVWTKKEFKEFSAPYFEKGNTWDFKKINRNVYTDNKEYIWFNETLNTWMGVCRGSGTIHFNSDTQKFEIKQYVLSLTVPNDKIKDVINAIDQP